MKNLKPVKPKKADYKYMPACSVHSIFDEYARACSKPLLILYVKFPDGTKDSYEFEPAKTEVFYRVPSENNEQYSVFIDTCRFNGDFLFSYDECKANKEYTSKAAILKRFKSWLASCGTGGVIVSVSNSFDN